MKGDRSFLKGSFHTLKRTMKFPGTVSRQKKHRKAEVWKERYSGGGTRHCTFTRPFMIEDCEKQSEMSDDVMII